VTLFHYRNNLSEAENEITKPERTVSRIPNPITFRFPILSANIPKGRRARSAPRKYPEKRRLEATESPLPPPASSGRIGITALERP